jgi:hypothetical protein
MGGPLQARCNVGAPAGSLTDEAANLLARRRILELIEYISTLQGKPAVSR